MRKTKYEYWFIVQGYYGDGWEDLDWVEKNQRHRFDGRTGTARQYANWLVGENSMNGDCACRIIERRTLRGE